MALALAPASAAHADEPGAPDSVVRAIQVGAVGADKFEHASLSLTLGIGVGVATQKPALALSAPLAFGLAKEVRDRRHTRFDPADLVADLIGSALAAVVVREIAR